MKTKAQLINEIKTSGAYYVTYGDSDLGIIIPIDDAIADIDAMEDESIGEGTWMRLTDRATKLYNNGLDWYVVTLTDGSHELKHQSALSSILDCGQPAEDYGIVKIERCWNGENLTDEDDWV